MDKSREPLTINLSWIPSKASGLLLFAAEIGQMCFVPDWPVSTSTGRSIWPLVYPAVGAMRSRAPVFIVE